MRISDGLTPAEVAILGILSEGETHGYGINEIIEERGMRRWTSIGFSSIYAILNRLEKEGMIRSHLDTSGRLPARKLYRITSKGENALRNAVKHYLSRPERLPMRVDLGAANIHVLSMGEAIRCLETYCKDLRENIGMLERMMWEQESLPFTAEIVFEHALVKSRAELEWAENLINKLKKRGGRKRDG